jgi:predicted small secreted protein
MRTPKRELSFTTSFVKALTLVVMSTVLAACNTWSGFGKDLQHLGKSIEDRAKQSASTDK